MVYINRTSEMTVLTPCVNTDIIFYVSSPRLLYFIEFNHNVDTFSETTVALFQRLLVPALELSSSVARAGSRCQAETRLRALTQLGCLQHLEFLHGSGKVILAAESSRFVRYTSEI